MRDQLLAAARDVLIEGGLVGFSMRKVAARCDVSATAIYRHFDDKDALLTAAVGEAFGIFGQYLMRSLTEKDPLDRFRAMGSQYFAFGREHSRYYQLIFMTNCADLGMGKLDEATRGRAGGTFQMLVDRIEECQHVGVFARGDSRAQAAFAWSSYHGLSALALTGNLGVTDAVLEGLEAAQVEGVVTALREGRFWAEPPPAHRRKRG